MSRVPTHVLYEVGEYETGCFTHAGNDLALYTANTRKLYDGMQQLFVRARRGIKSSFSGEPLIPPGPPEPGYRYDITKNTGLLVPTLVHDYFHRATKLLYRVAVSSYDQELADPLEKDADTYDDFVLWMIRQFENWISEPEQSAKAN